MWFRIQMQSALAKFRNGSRQASRLLHMENLLEAACKLNRHLLREHWSGQLLVGPDPGIRINYRFGRFAKSYLRKIPWRDHMVYMQAQGYWILAQWLLADQLD